MKIELLDDTILSVQKLPEFIPLKYTNRYKIAEAVLDYS